MKKKYIKTIVKRKASAEESAYFNEIMSAEVKRLKTCKRAGVSAIATFPNMAPGTFT